MLPDLWGEYDSAAEWCAKRGSKGRNGDRLPENLSSDVLDEINGDIDAFQERVKNHAFALAMMRVNGVRDAY